MDCTRRHVLVTGPTEAGKNSILVPTLLDGWRSDALIFDPTCEIVDYCGARRRAGSHLCVFDPSDRASVGMNPIAWLRDGDGFVPDALALAAALSSFGGDVTRAGHFDLAAWGFLAAALVHVARSPEPGYRRIGAARRLLGKKDPISTMLREQRHPFAVSAANVLASDDNDLGSNYARSVISTAFAWLVMWEDETFDEITAKDELRLSDLGTHSDPVTLVVQFRPSDRERGGAGFAQAIGRLFVRTHMHDPTQTLDGRPVRRWSTVFVDELVEVSWSGLPSVLNAARHYAKRFVMCAQSEAQVEEHLGPGIVRNARTRVRLRPDDIEEAKRMSAACGESLYRVKRASTMHDGPFGIAAERGTVTRDLVAKPALSVNDIMGWKEYQHALVTGHGKAVVVDMIDWRRQKPWAGMVGGAGIMRDPHDGAHLDLPPRVVVGAKVAAPTVVPDAPIVDDGADDRVKVFG